MGRSRRTSHGIFTDGIAGSSYCGGSCQSSQWRSKFLLEVKVGKEVGKEGSLGTLRVRGIAYLNFGHRQSHPIRENHTDPFFFSCAQYKCSPHRTSQAVPVQLQYFDALRLGRDNSLITHFRFASTSVGYPQPLDRFA